MFLAATRMRSIAIRALLGTLFICAVLFSITEASADETNLELGVEAQHRVTSPTALLLGQHLELDLDELGLDKSSTNIGAVHLLTNWFVVSSVYRAVVEPSHNGWALEHRPYVDAGVKIRLFYLDLSWRLRVEYRLKDQDSYVRVREKVKVTLKTIPGDPFIANEIFIPMEGPIEKHEVCLGFSPFSNLSTFYLLEMEFGTTTEYKNIFGIDYSFNL
jgi:hypothetical protein